MTEARADRFLSEVELRMREMVARVSAAAPVRPLLEAGGKRLRVRLLWWSAVATGGSPIDCYNDTLVRAAVAVEFAHLGSLIHDDIADNSATRRGVMTIHRSHGLAAAVAAGSTLAHLASEIVATLGSAARLAVRRAILATCRGQIRELALAFERVTPRMRLMIMQEKTAAFVELAAVLGALVGGADVSKRAAVCRFARRFGLAFQIADDVLDLAGDPRELGRANGADICDGIATFPIILANNREAVYAALSRVQRQPTAETIADCALLVRKGGGLAAATSAAIWWLEESLRQLDGLSSDSAVRVVKELARATVFRGLRSNTAQRYLDQEQTHPMRSNDHALWSSIAKKPLAAIHDPRLTNLLDWFYPGLSSAVDELASLRSVRRSRLLTRHQLLLDDAWSNEATIAADAIAIAGAISEHELHASPRARLALVDALYCSAIGELCRAPNADEHAELEARARGLAPTADLSPRPAITRAALADRSFAVSLTS